jgi:hypothetical protein
MLTDKNWLEAQPLWLMMIVLFIYGVGVEPSPLLLLPFISLLYQSWMINCYDCGAVSGINDWQGKLEYSDKTYPSVALSTPDPTWLDLGCCSGKPATNCRSYSTAIMKIVWQWIVNYKGCEGNQALPDERFCSRGTEKIGEKHCLGSQSLVWELNYRMPQIWNPSASHLADVQYQYMNFNVMTW